MIKPNFEFQERFGKIFGLIPDGQLVYESRKGKLYSIPRKHFWRRTRKSYEVECGTKKEFSVKARKKSWT